MQGNSEEIYVQIKADIADLKNGFKEATDAVTNSTSQMKSDLHAFSQETKETMGTQLAEPFNNLSGQIERFKAMFLEFGAAFEGVRFLKETISATNDLTRQIDEMSQVLGISMKEASGLRIALDSLGISSESYQSMALRLSMQLRSNQQRLEELGLSINDASGKHKSMQEIMQDGVKLLLQYKEGFDRNVVAMELFGRTAESVSDLIRLNDEVTKEGQAAAEKYGLVVGTQNVEQMYR